MSGGDASLIRQDTAIRSRGDLLPYRLRIVVVGEATSLCRLFCQVMRLSFRRLFWLSVDGRGVRCFEDIAVDAVTDVCGRPLGRHSHDSHRLEESVVKVYSVVRTYTILGRSDEGSIESTSKVAKHWKPVRRKESRHKGESPDSAVRLELSRPMQGLLNEDEG